MPEKHFDANEIARISAGLIAAIAEAQTLAADAKIGVEFRELLRHAREMHDLLVQHLDGGTECVRGWPIRSGHTWTNSKRLLEAI